MTVADRPITGTEAAALYTELVQAKRQAEHVASRQRNVLIDRLREGGQLSIEEALQRTGLPPAAFYALLADVLADGGVQAHGTLLKLIDSPGTSQS